MEVKAEIHDLSSIENYNGEPFLVDTNIWLWITYSKIMPTKPELRDKVIQYTDKIMEMQREGALLVYSALTFSEVATNIEKQELAEHISSRNPDLNFRESKSKVFSKKKLFRNDINIRNRVADEISASISQIVDLADKQADDNLTKLTIEQFVKDIRETTLDGTDVLLKHIGVHDDIVNVVTDDKDYGSVDGLRVFTLNKELI